MIVDAIVTGFFGIFTALFSIFPDLPPMPVLISDGWNFIISLTNQAFGVLVYFLSTPLYLMALGLIIFMTTFHYVYQFFIRFLIFRIFMGFVGR